MRPQKDYGALAPYYDIFIDWEKRLAAEIPFILGCLPAERSGLSCLDIGCGTGRHLERLRATGLRIEGCEPSDALRRQARENLPGAAIHTHSMQRLACLADTNGPWDLVICLGNTLAHLEPGLRPGFFAALAEATAPRGRAVIHLLGYDRIARLRPLNLPEKVVERDGQSYTFQREYVYAGDKIEFTLKVLVNSRPVAEQKETLYPLGGDGLSDHCRAAGFREAELFDGFDRNRPYTRDSANIVCVLSH